ncbi:NADP-dependent oxidoreductase [Kitasatospora sp. NBC_01266]|uniref:NADP-dependent oxidoreductase n=1 Tax=Kitasatospora sp. NBC_01266 TaxID=2903572 RepID=UPI002E3726A0|nr:NADP-dependent oxidoreductase [Kitasatospora sp. NBC_01266]
MSRTYQAVHQVSRPIGPARAENFAFVEDELPPLTAGTVLVENVYLSVDPYMREAMDEGHWELNTPLEGRAIGRVIESRTPELAVGDLVFHRRAWRTHAVLTPAQLRPLPAIEGVPVSTHLSLLGGTGLSAYVGLTRVLRLQPGESVFISAAAGGVGTAAGQFARLLGAGRIVGSAGSAAKVAHLTERAGFDAAFDYHDGPVAELLRAAAPEGIDTFFDNVGGDHLEGALEVLRDHGRIAWCGAVAQYSTEPPAAPRNLYDVVGKSLRLEGFLVREHLDAQQELTDFLVPHLRSGRVRAHETVVAGFENVVTAFLSMLGGANIGKMLVQTADLG